MEARICILLLILWLSQDCHSLSRCPSTWYDFKGYTYTVDPETKERIWSHCKYPNPTADLERCGFSDSFIGPAYICDPDKILSSDSNVLEKINTQLIAIQQNTSTLCASSDTQRQSYIVTIAITNRMRVADLHDADSCINDCNEIHPELNRTARVPTDEEINKMMVNFADSLRVSWRLGACDNDVVVFYNKEFNKIYSSVGSKASSFLTESILSSLHSAFLNSVKTGRIEDGLLNLVEDVRTSLRSFTPAHILLIINAVIIVFLIVFFIMFLHMSDVELNVWGNEKQWAAIDFVVKFVTGVWFLNVMLIGIGNILHRLNIWAAVVCLIAAVGCGVIVYQHEMVLTSRSNIIHFNFTT